MKKKFVVRMLVVAIAIVGFSCNNSSTENSVAFDLAKTKQEIEAANQDFMDLVSKGDSVGIANMYATDAKLMGPNEPAVTGKKNIQASFAYLIKAGITKADLKAIDVWGTPEIVTEEGELALFASDGTQIEKGKYIVVWKKEEGKWKIFRDMFNSDLPIPAPN